MCESKAATVIYNKLKIRVTLISVIYQTMNLHLNRFLFHHYLFYQLPNFSCISYYYHLLIYYHSWPCLHQWLETRPNRQVCPVCKAAISRDKVIPLYGRGNTKQEDPRNKVDCKQHLTVTYILLNMI